MRAIPDPIMASVNAVLEHGAQKHGADSWRKKDAIHYARKIHSHLVKWEEGSKLDVQSGLHHLAHIAANAVLGLACELMGA